MSLAEGTRLAQYVILGPLGAGGMGEVYRAHDERLGRDVALKVLPEHLSDDAEMRARFEHEARAIAAISHPNIMAIHELALVAGQPIAVVELLEGESLRARLARGPMPWRDAAQMAARVADGLAAAHAKGIVHRDLKPENIVITLDERPKILDFGLARSDPGARQIGESAATIAPTEPGRVLGTVGYMAPEQVRGEPAQPATDLFALGCTLAEMLTGDRPYAKPTIAESVAAVLHDPAPDLAASGRDIPPRLAEVVAHCLEKRPADRFSSARDVAAALRALLTDSSSAQVDVPRRRGRVRALAVLPFVNLDADRSADYLADGITESIINSLSQLPKLRVVPRSTVFAYKGRDVNPRSVGLTLNVDSLVTGRIIQQGSILNIQAELVDVTKETQLWGDQYRHPVADLLALQEQIAWQISEALRIRLTGQERKRLHKRPTASSEAYQEYLRGRHQWGKWSPDGFAAAVEHYEAAIARDPKYARAYAGLAETYAAMGYYGHLPTEVAMTRAAAAAYKALDLEPELAEAHGAMGIGRMFYSWDWIGAEHAMRKAIELNPRYPAGHMYYALLQTALSRHDEALAEARRGRELDPLSLLMQMGVAWALYFGRRYQEALEALREVTLIEPGFPDAISMLTVIYERLGLLERAAESFGHNASFFGVSGHEELPDRLKEGLSAGGAAGYWRARHEAAGLFETAGRGAGVAAYVRATCDAQLGNVDAAFAHLEQMTTARVGQCVFLMVDPGLDPLHADPRWEQVLRRLGSPLALAAR